MKVYLISMMNAFVLILIGLWGYWGAQTPSPSSLIPVFSGAFLLSLVQGVRSGSRVIAHISVTLTLLLLIGLIMPLIGAIDDENSDSILRVVVMMISCAISMVYFIRSFINVRKARAKVSGQSQK
jgi:hypothetical protein